MGSGKCVSLVDIWGKVSCLEGQTALGLRGGYMPGMGREWQGGQCGWS